MTRIIVVTEAEFEQMLDACIMRELRRDGAYTNAENAEEQAERERVISEEQEARLLEKYEVTR